MEQNQLTPRPVSVSRAEHTQILLAEHLNGSGRLFGGRLMEWIDIVAGVAARRHSGCNVTTASIDTLHFKSPAFVNDTVVLVAKVTYVGRTSMEVRVRTYVEAPGGARKLINEAFVVIVALDENDRPTPVPPLVAQNEEEERIMREAALRQQMRKERLRELKSAQTAGASV